MTTIGQKADYVRGATQTRTHHCHWPGCDKQVPPALYACTTHWYKLPLALRNRIWRAYKIGQEITAEPTREYVDASRAVQEWIKANHGVSTHS